MLWVSGVCPAVAFYISKNLCALGTQLAGEGLLPAGVSMLDSLEGSERAADAGQLAVRPDKIVHSVYTSMGFSMQEYWSGLPLSSPECL